MIAIIDYGAGNLNSIQKALEYIGRKTVIIDSAEKEDIDRYNGLVLPGVGAFPGAMGRLENNKFISFIKEFVNSGKPFLGICLGMQLLFEWGYEDKKTQGLNLISGDVVKISSDYKIPHMGWNQLKILKDDPLFAGLPENPHFYFVHSYQLSELTDDTAAVVEYGVDIPAVVRKNNIIGLQFHPEKSGDNGIQMLKNFGEML